MISFSVKGKIKMVPSGIDENCGTWSDIGESFLFIPSCENGNIVGHLYLENGDNQVTINISGGNV